MNNRSFRLYRFVDAKFQYFGLSIGQYFIMIPWIAAFVLSKGIFDRVLHIIGMFVSLKIYRVISKKFEGVSCKSYIEWFLGINADLGPHFPNSAYRIVVGD